jgi:hypothetical protein
MKFENVSQTSASSSSDNHLSCPPNSTRKQLIGFYMEKEYHSVQKENEFLLPSEKSEYRRKINKEYNTDVKQLAKIIEIVQSRWKEKKWLQ